MVFSSLTFIFIFLPIAVLGYHALNRFHWGKASLLFLFLMSLVYYAYWKPEYTFIIIASIIVNYLLGQALIGMTEKRKPLFLLGLALNLGALAFFKYTDFVIATVNTAAGANIPLPGIVLPIGISFYTFQQIAYLSDIYTRKHEPDKGLLSYCLFICFFPQEVAGPIVHHHEMMPQFADMRNRGLNWNSMYAGIVLFAVGLAKKVLIADTMSPVAGALFNEVISPTLMEAWLGSIAYSVQLYFDFSAYSDMAMGCALFFNIRLPVNFDSPYKSRNIQEFWRRWHMTLSRWLRDYLYIPLGGNRKGYSRTLLNVFLTFLLGGLWHGAAWTFVAWGALHGAALAVHRIWGRYVKVIMPRAMAWILTLLFVNAAWVMFRAGSFADAVQIYAGMLGMHGTELGEAFKLGMRAHVAFAEFSYPLQRTLLVLFTLLALFAPNSLRILGNEQPRTARSLFVLILGTLSVCILASPGYLTEFIYFQF